MKPDLRIMVLLAVLVALPGCQRQQVVLVGEAKIAVAAPPDPPDMNSLCALIGSARDDDGPAAAELEQVMTRYSKPGESLLPFYLVDEDGVEVVDDNDEYVQSTLSVVETNILRLASLCSVWYPGNPLPDIDPNSWISACVSAYEGADDDPEYRDFLGFALDLTAPDAPQNLLCYFAILDQDDDGIADFRINSYGRFGENDTDVDNDGIANVRDARPFSADAGGGLSCGAGTVPEHLRAGFCTHEGPACGLQQRLYSEFDIAAVNRDFATDDPRLVTGLRAVYDTLNLVYRGGIEILEQAAADCPGLPTLPSLKTVAFAECSLGSIRNPLDESAEQRCDDAKTIQAEAIAQNATFSIFPDGAGFPGLFKLGVWVHELAHSWQFALDYSDQRRRELDTLNYWNTPNFKELMEEFGWQIPVSDKLDEARLIYANRAVFDMTEITLFDAGDYRFNGEPTGNLQNMIVCGVDDPDGACFDTGEYTYVGYIAEQEEFDRDRRALFTSYGANDPWEWHADAAMAYLYRLLSDHLAVRSSADTVEGLNVWLRTRVLETWPGNDFFYENISDQAYQRFSVLFPVTAVQLDELVCRYIVNSDDTLFAANVEGIGIDEHIPYGTGWARSPADYEVAMVSELPISYEELLAKLQGPWRQDNLRRQIGADWGPVCAGFEDLGQANSVSGI